MSNRFGDASDGRGLQLALEKLPTAAYTCDADGLITWFNDHVVRLWGRTPRLNDPADRWCGSFKLFSTSGRPVPHCDCWMGLTLKTDREIEGGEIVVERPDGTRVVALAHVTPLHDGSGKLTGAVNVLVDITARKRLEGLNLVERNIAQALAEETTFHAAAQRVLRTAGEQLGFAVGALWEIESAKQQLRCTAFWRSASAQVDAFEEETRRRTFAPGVGLPGRIWANRSPAWTEELSNDANFPRFLLAKGEGLKSGFGYPIMLRGEVLGVVEYFSDEPRARDEALLERMATIGMQLGQFLDRRRAEELRAATAAEKAGLLQSLKDADRRKNEFLAVLAHELRNPLAPIRNAARLVSLRASGSPDLQWAGQ